MSFREKSIWVSLLATLGVWGWYFATLGLAIGRGGIAPGMGFGNFFQAVAALVVIQVGAAIAIALWRPAEADVRADARDREFAGSAARWAYAALTVMVVLVMLGVPPIAVAASRHAGAAAGIVAAIYIANALLAALVAAHVINASLQLVRYRREG